MVNQNVQHGGKSSCVKAMSLLCWTVAAITVYLETAIHPVMLLDSPVQVGGSTDLVLFTA